VNVGKTGTVQKLFSLLASLFFVEFTEQLFMLVSQLHPTVTSGGIEIAPSTMYAFFQKFTFTLIYSFLLFLRQRLSM
jgi:hypothetical protein